MGKKHDTGCPGGDDCRDNAHLCRVARNGDISCMKDLVRDAEYICRKCGRAARLESNLCKPEGL